MILQHVDRATLTRSVRNYEAWLFDPESVDSPLFDEETEFRISTPFGRCSGISAWADCARLPIRQALDQPSWTTMMRLDQTENGGGQIAFWGTLTGRFVDPLCGIRPSGREVSLRVGGVLDVTEARVPRCTIMIDLVDLALQAHQSLLADPLGAIGLWPPPRVTNDSVNATSTLEIVRTMQSALHDTAKTREEMLNAPHLQYWRDGFVWSGPGGIGITYGATEFVERHQLPFRTSFPDRIGGGVLPNSHQPESVGHFVKFADGAWAVTGGWPSMTATHTGNGWLGLDASGIRVTLRVFDFYEVEEGLISMNWVFIDILNFLEQIGKFPPHIHGYQSQSRE